jgi:hypothetical protein
VKVYAGRTILMVTRTGGKEHLWIVATEPFGSAGEVVIVSLTTDRPDKEQTVRLSPSDHPFIRWPTIVFFTDAQLKPVDEIIALIRKGEATFHDDCSEELLQAIIDGLLASPNTPRRVKRIVSERA